MADPGAGSDARIRRALALFLAGSVALRVGLALTVPVLGEEAYYVHWGWHPAIGYLDHPPVVAWLAGLSVGVFGPSRLGVRLPALVLGLAAIAVLVALGRRTVGRPAAWAGAALFLAMPLSHGYGLVATPDAPLLFFGLLFAWLAAEALLGGRPAAWLLAGAAAGLAGLSKYSAVLVPMGILVFVLADRDARRQFLGPWPWLGAAVAAAVVSPVVLWNARHDWMSFAFQSTRRAGKLGGPNLAHPFEFLFGQACLVTPVLFAGVVWALVVALRRSSPRGERFLACVALPNCVLMTAISPFTWVKLNWVFPAYAPLALVLAARWLRGEPAWLRGPWRARVRRLGLLTGPVLAALVSFHVLVGIPFVRSLPRLHGWDEVARRAEAEIDGMDPAGRPFLVGAGKNYQPASALALHLGHRREVHSVEVLGLGGRQYDFWFDEAALLGRDAVVVIPVKEREGKFRPSGRDRPDLRLSRCFTSVDPPVVLRMGGPDEVYLIFRCHGYRGVPPR